MCVWAGNHLHFDTAKHGDSGVVKESTGEWNGAIVFLVMRIGSVCMRVMDVHVYSVDLVSVIIRSAFAHDTQAPPEASWCWIISYNSWPYLVFLQGKVNSARYISQVVNSVLLSFLRQEGDVLFQQNNALPHTAAATQTAQAWAARQVT